MIMGEVIDLHPATVSRIRSLENNVVGELQKGDAFSPTEAHAIGSCIAQQLLRHKRLEEISLMVLLVEKGFPAKEAQNIARRLAR